MTQQELIDSLQAKIGIEIHVGDLYRIVQKQVGLIVKDRIAVEISRFELKQIS